MLREAVGKAIVGTKIGALTVLALVAGLLGLKPNGSG